MERFVMLLVAGGLALVAGLWLATLGDGGTAAWVSGVILAALGSLSLAAGMGQEIAF